MLVLVVVNRHGGHPSQFYPTINIDVSSFITEVKSYLGTWRYLEERESRQWGCSRNALLRNHSIKSSCLLTIDPSSTDSEYYSASTLQTTLMIASRLVRPILSTTTILAALIKPANTPQLHALRGNTAATQQLVRKMHIQSIPMC